MLHTMLHTILLCSLLALSHASNDPIVMPALADATGPEKLFLFVPGGKVPPEDYKTFIAATQSRLAKNFKLSGAIVRCGQLNLCNPLGGLDGEVKTAIAAVSKAVSFNFTYENIFLTGHSLGGVGARHFYDAHNGKDAGGEMFAGLAMYGTQYNGDHEDYHGTLGYPIDLAKFPTPMLALLGELDMVPTSHAGLVFEQMVQLPKDQQPLKPVVVIPGMDHSQFCSPFNVSGDNQPEIPNVDALTQISEVMAAWISSVALPGKTGAEMVLAGYNENTAKITTPFVKLAPLDHTDWCRQAQFLIANLTEDYQKKLKVNVHWRDSNTNLEHARTNYTFADGILTLDIYAFADFPNASVTQMFLPTYSAANTIACKLVSSDRIQEVLDYPNRQPQPEPAVDCKAVNEAAVDLAVSQLAQSWPYALERFASKGRPFVFADDSEALAGPQWCFAGLGFKVRKTSVTVQSERLYSNLQSSILPGNHYCKLLSPAKALEWIMTTSLTARY